MRNIIRFLAAIAAVVAAGLFIYFNSPASDHSATTKEDSKKADEAETKNEFSVDLPDIDLDKDSSAEAPQLDKLKRQAQSMHATINHVAAEGAFDGNALNTGKIKKDLEKLNMQVEETKQGCANCAADITNYLASLQAMTKNALEGDAQELGRLYTNLSEFDRQLNGLDALADIRDLADLFNQDKAGPRFEAIDDWIKEAKARLDRDSGDLQLDKVEELKAKRAELEAKIEKAKAAAQKVDQLKKQLAQKDLPEAKRKELEKKLAAAQQQAEELKKAGDDARNSWQELENQVANTKADREAFIKQAKEEADKRIAESKNTDIGNDLVHIKDLADTMLKSKEQNQKQLDELAKAFDEMHKKTKDQ